MSLLDHMSVFAGVRLEAMTFREARREFERAYFERLLALHGGDVSEVWEASGISDRSTVYRKMHSVGIDMERVREIRNKAKGAREAG